MFVFKQNIDQSYVRNEMTMHFDFHPKYAISFLCHKAECHSHFFLLSLLIFLPSNLALNPFPLSPFKSCKICHLQSWFNFEPNFQLQQIPNSRFSNMTWLKFALQKIITNIWLTVFQKMLDSILISITLDKEQLKFAKKKTKKITDYTRCLTTETMAQAI